MCRQAGLNELMMLVISIMNMIQLWWIITSHRSQLKWFKQFMMTSSNGLTWWRHQLETFPALLAICAGNKGQRRGALMFSLICVWINGWVNNGEACDSRCYRAHNDIILMYYPGLHFTMLVKGVLDVHIKWWLCALLTVAFPVLPLHILIPCDESVLRLTIHNINIGGLVMNDCL